MAVAIAREREQHFISGAERIGILTDRQFTRDTHNHDGNQGSILTITVNLQNRVLALAVVAIETNVAFVAPPKVLPRAGVNTGQVDQGVNFCEHGSSITRMQ